MAISFGWGFTLAFISMICNGSFSSLNKLPTVQSSNINPQIFNLYFIFGVIISSILVYIITLLIGWTITFTYLGVISGFLLSISAVTLFATMKYIGLSIGVTIWSGTAILVSFAEGFIVSTDVEYLYIAIIGITILLIGVIGVGFSQQIIEKYYNHINQDSIVSMTSMVAAEYEIVDDTTLLIADKNQNKIKNIDMILGIFYAVLTGISGGTIAFPSNYTDENNEGVKYVISFAVGCCLILPITICWVYFISKGEVEWHFNTCLCPGIVAGVIWNVGNVASLYAIQSLGYNVAYPMFQSSLIIANLWGIFVWKEFKDRKVIATILTFSIVVLIGCGAITVGVNGIS
eukprot:74298_1